MPGSGVTTPPTIRQRATDTFHAEAVASNYIRAGRTDRNITWRQSTAYGVMDMTINVSKPEKDPRDIAAAAHVTGAGYPACLLCRENEGYPGRADHPARQNLRLDRHGTRRRAAGTCSTPRTATTPSTASCSARNTGRCASTRWRWPGSRTSPRLLPHYLIGSNADLPIVGGSILSHDHFQGGRFEFAMDRARAAVERPPDGRHGATCCTGRWPCCACGARMPTSWRSPTGPCRAWREYSSPEHAVLAWSDGVPHNTSRPSPAARVTDCASTWSFATTARPRNTRMASSTRTPRSTRSSGRTSG